MGFSPEIKVAIVLVLLIVLLDLVVLALWVLLSFKPGVGAGVPGCVGNCATGVRRAVHHSIACAARHVCCAHGSIVGNSLSIYTAVQNKLAVP